MDKNEIKDKALYIYFQFVDAQGQMSHEETNKLAHTLIEKINGFMSGYNAVTEKLDRANKNGGGKE